MKPSSGLLRWRKSRRSENIYRKRIITVQSASFFLLFSWYFSPKFWPFMFSLPFNRYESFSLYNFSLVILIKKKQTHRSSSDNIPLSWSPDKGSIKPKHFNVDFTIMNWIISFGILSFSISFIYIYIYIYIYISLVGNVSEKKNHIGAFGKKLTWVKSFKGKSIIIHWVKAKRDTDWFWASQPPHSNFYATSKPTNTSGSFQR